MNHVVMGLLRQRLPVTNQMVDNLIAIELAYINMNQPDFVGGTRATYESYMMSQTTKDFTYVPQNAEGSSAPKSELLPGSSSQRRPPPDSHNQQRGWFSLWPVRGQHQQPQDAHTSSSVSKTPNDADVGLNDIVEAEAEDRQQALDNPDATQPVDMLSRQNFDCELIEKLISSYFLIVRKSVQDSIPKAVMHCLVSYVQEKLQSELVSELYRAELCDELMEEAPGMTARRREVAEMVKALKKASGILNEIRDLQFESNIVGFSDFAEY